MWGVGGAGIGAVSVPMVGIAPSKAGPHGLRFGWTQSAGKPCSWSWRGSWSGTVPYGLGVRGIVGRGRSGFTWMGRLEQNMSEQPKVSMSTSQILLSGLAKEPDPLKVLEEGLRRLNLPLKGAWLEIHRGRLRVTVWKGGKAPLERPASPVHAGSQIMKI